MLLHVLAHVDAHHGLLVVEEELGQRARGFGFAHARRSEENETEPIGPLADRSSPRANGEWRWRRRSARRPGRPRARAAASSIWTSFFTSPSSMRETGMPVHLLTILAMSSSSTSSFNMRAHARVAVLRGVQLLQLGFQLRQLAILDLRGALELALAGLLFGLEAQRLDLLLQLADAADGLALLCPARAQSRDLLASAWPASRSTSSRRSLLFVSVSRFSAARSISSEVASGAPAGRSPSARSRSGWPAKPRLRRPGRWPCRAGSGR